MTSITTFIEKKLGLIVNASKSKIGKPTDIKFLGFGYYYDYKMNRYEVNPHEKSWMKFKWKIKVLMKRSWSVEKDYFETGNKLPEVLFCANDEMAIGVINYLNEMKVDIPKAMKIIGFDNIELGKYIKPQLTTIDVNRAEWARILAESIVSAIEGRTAEIQKYDARFAIIRRETF